jgi:predicted PurR-regulated permease PerM
LPNTFPSATITIMKNTSFPDAEREEAPSVPRALAGGRRSTAIETAWAFATIGLFLLAVLYTLFLAKAIMMPVAVACLVALLLAPLVRALRAAFVPRPVGAAIVLACLVTLIIGGITVLSDPASKWAAELPKTTKQLERKFRTLKNPLDDMRQATERVEQLTTLEKPEDVPQRVVVETGGLFARTVGVLQSVGSTLGIIVALVYFLLATGDLLEHKLLHVWPGGRGKRAMGIAHVVQRSLSTYFATVTLINIGLGMATSAAMFAIDMPNPVLWGAMAAALNFVPLIGAVVGVGVVALVGLVSFPTIVNGLLPAALYLGLHLVESQFVTPYIVGRRLTMNPVAVFLSIVLWTWLWGIPGALMAVPLLAVLKVVADTIEPLKPISAFVGDDTETAEVS